ncbi:MAG: hypothetical protein AAB423_01160 [Patescibacteria group bacterium]
MRDVNSQPPQGGFDGSVQKYSGSMALSSSELYELASSDSASSPNQAKLQPDRKIELIYWLAKGELEIAESNLAYDIYEKPDVYLSEYSYYLGEVIEQADEESDIFKAIASMLDGLLATEQQTEDYLRMHLANGRFSVALDLLYEQKIIPPIQLLNSPDREDFGYTTFARELTINDQENPQISDCYETLCNILYSGDVDRAMGFAIREAKRIPLSLPALCIDWSETTSDLLSDDSMSNEIIRTNIRFRDALALYCTLTEVADIKANS